MKMDIEIKGMEMKDEDREAVKSNAARILQAYSDGPMSRNSTK